MKVALIHHWLVKMRGGEKVLEQLCLLYPDADIFTHVLANDFQSDIISNHKITTTFINRLPLATKWYQRYLPFMPMALEQLDLRGYDLVISIESGPSKGVITDPDCVHICYCNSPMRYLWNMYHDYRDNAGGLTRRIMGPLFHYVRQWDQLSADRVDHFIGNSNCIADRVRKFYRRDAAVIFPPVAVDDFAPINPADKGDYYFMCGQLTRYKRPDLAIEACNKLGKKLVVVGGGEELDAMKALAGPTVDVLGPQPFHVLQDHYAHAKALIFPGLEDFGIVPLEASASGTPVIAYGRGGALDTVIDGETGLFFEDQTVDSLCDAIERFEADPTRFDTNRMVAQARSFSNEIFRENMERFVEEKMNTRSQIPHAAY